MALNTLDSGASLRVVVPHDTNELAVVNGKFPRFLYIGVAGDLVVTTVDDTASVTLKAVPVGLLRIQAKIVLTATAATDMVAVY